MTARHADEYVLPSRADVVVFSSDRIGVTDGLLLKFPQIQAVGDISLMDRPRIAIVGARKATAEGRRRAAQLARDCARAGIVVVSGLAEGIDYAAHTAAIDHGGKTIAVVGTPLDKVYPAKHAALQHAIYRDHLLLSPFTWGDKFVPSNFPERNRIMARLAMATVIIEASDTRSARSRRSRATLAEELQVEQGRDARADRGPPARGRRRRAKSWWPRPWRSETGTAGRCAD